MLYYNIIRKYTLYHILLFITNILVSLFYGIITIIIIMLKDHSDLHYKLFKLYWCFITLVFYFPFISSLEKLKIWLCISNILMD